MMNEGGWLGCEGPSRMMRHLRQTEGTERRPWFPRRTVEFLPRLWRHFIAAACWRVYPLLGDDEECARQLLEYAEGYADRSPTDTARKRINAWPRTQVREFAFRRLLLCLNGPLAQSAGGLREIAGRHAWGQAPKPEREPALRSAQVKEGRAQCALIRDIFGNPFCPPTFDPAWRTPTAAGLAQAAYDERLMPSRELDPARLAVLSDALEESGCAEAAILTHLRSPGPHVRGCWALDLILAKERGS